MPQIPFPHILTVPKDTNNHLFRVVSPNKLKVGSVIYNAFQSALNKNTNAIETQYETFTITLKQEERPAKGNWTNWSCHPFYFEGQAKYNGLTFESDKLSNK